MPLADAFLEVRRAVVAFMPRAIPTPPGGMRPDLFPIVGIGFILDDGLVVTNAHVIEALYHLPRPPNWPPDKAPFKVVLFYAVDQTRYPNVPAAGRATFQVAKKPGHNEPGSEDLLMTPGGAPSIQVRIEPTGRE